jgi:peptidyl-prolyl cis-trans isomerase-like 6
MVNSDNSNLYTIYVNGSLNTNEFQKAKCCAQDLFKKLPTLFNKPVINAMFEFSWAQWLKEKKKELKEEVWSFDDAVMIFLNNELIGNLRQFLAWSIENYNFEEYRTDTLYEALKYEEYAAQLASTQNDFVFMDITIDNEPIGRLMIQLFNNIVPKTCDNFRLLCTGENGRSKTTSYALHYKNQIIHRIVPNGWIQGGDIMGGKGNGGESAFGGLFEDESYAISHNKRGIIGMANNGRHTNSSQFYITLQAATWMDKTYVAFG